MIKLFRPFLGAVVLGAASCAAQQFVFQVPATANVWLAGMPDGATAPLADTVPSESPTLAPLSITGGMYLRITATGQVNWGVGGPLANPDGRGNSISHLDGPANGIADLVAPHLSLIGVFLGDNQPDGFPTIPDPLNFSNSESQNALSISPGLRQPFFIGDGLGQGDVAQLFIAPEGATRLFLGAFDDFENKGNEGFRSVTLTAVPEPAEYAVVAGAALAGFVVWRRRAQLTGTASRVA